MKRFLFLVLILCSPLALRAQAPNQMVTISSNGKYLVNSITGKPVFLTGDAPQIIFEQISNADLETYLADRQARGFNAIWVYPVDTVDQSNPPKNFQGNVPFDGADFTNFDTAYWAQVDYIVGRIQAYGMTAFMNVAYAGFPGQGYYLNSLLASSDATMTAYGTFLGNRYKNAPNIVWVLGGDSDPGISGLYPKLTDIGNGLAAADPNHLITLEACRSCSTFGGNLSSIAAYSGNPPSFMDLNWVYNTQSTVVAGCQAGFAATAAGAIPPLMGEDWYELEHSMTGFQERQEGYWEALSGCYLGRFFGNAAIYSFNSPHAGVTSPSWQSQLGSTGSVGQQYLGVLMRSREHWLMAPDTTHTWLTAGFGSGSTLSVAARSSDGQTIIAYLSNGNATAKTINMSAITSATSTAIAWWYNPQTGAATLIGTFPNSGSQTFTAPDGNDWVLVIDDASANLGAPGGGAANNPVPSIASLNPTTVAAGGPAFTLTVNGSGFIQASVVNFNGNAKATTFVSASQLTATIPASDIAASGNSNVTVTNPAPGGGTTSNFTFTISSAANPAPTLASISPTSGALGQGVSLTLNGTNFISSSVVNFGGNANTGGVVSNGGNTLTIAIPAGQLVAAGSLNVTVTNPTPGGGTTGAQSFTVNNPAPSITTISPASAALGGSGFTLTVNGANFVNGSNVNFNGAVKATTFVSATKLTASILASDIAVAGTFPVTVTSPAPGGGSTASVDFSVTNTPLTLSSIAPTSTIAGGAAFTLTLNGSGFISGATVNFGANPAITPSSTTSTQIIATVPASDIAAAGTANVSVTNPAPGGGTSSTQSFTINNPAPTAMSTAPASASAGGAAFNLTVNGTGFVSTSVVKFNGASKATTFGSATQLTAAIAAADIAAVGTATVTVTNPAPGGGTSANIQFAISNLNVAITSLSPASASAGGGAFTLTVNGSGFLSGATVNFGSNPSITPSSITGTQIIATIPAADIGTGGTANVTVSNPGGGSSSAQTFTINNPAPTASSIAPTSAAAGGAAFTLTVNGSGFVNTSVVNFNGIAKATTFKSATQLTAAIAAADLLTAGALNVSVKNPAPGGGTSGAQVFSVNNPAPAATSISPTSATEGGAGFTLTVNGTGFLSTSIVKFNGVSKTTTFQSATQLTAAIAAADIATAGTANVSVTNPAPGGGASANVQFTINNPTVGITSLSPTSTTAGGAAFTLTVNGSGFVSGSVVKFNGSTKTTTFKSASQLTAAIATSDILTAGTPNVTVTNPAPGGGTSSAASFTINNAPPTVSSLSPSSATAGSAAFTLTVTGSQFVNGATVQFNGANRTTTFVSSTSVTAAILASDIDTAGSANVSVTNPAPTTGASSPKVFTIGSSDNPAPTISSLGTTHIAGGAAFTLTVNGANFQSKSVVNFNGKAESTTFVSATKISAAIPASDVATAGNVDVAVTNPAPGGGTSPASVFTVDGYSISLPSDASLTTGQPATVQITITPTANGFASPVVLSISGLPAGATASFNPTTVTPNGKAVSSTLTITNGGFQANSRPSVLGGRTMQPLLALWMIALLGWLCSQVLSRSNPLLKRYGAVAMAVALVLLTGGILSGCAGVTSTPSGQTSQLTVKAASGTLAQTANVTLSITP